jgi:hypothetical protein
MREADMILKSVPNCMKILALAITCFSCLTLSAGATLYNYPEGTDFGADELALIPSAGIYGDAGFPGKQAEDFYGIEILGFELTPDDFGLLSWEVTYSGPEGERIGPTRKPYRWTFNPSKKDGAAYIYLSKVTGGSNSGGYGGSGGGGTGGFTIPDGLLGNHDIPNQNTYSTPPGGNGGQTQDNNPPGGGISIPEPGTFLILATGLSGLVGALVGSRRIRRRYL